VNSKQKNNFGHPKKNAAKESGQVVTEYVLILTLVFTALVMTKLKVTTYGTVTISADPNDKTIMETLSNSFTIWMRDMMVIISLPS
jgi:hypothetical protein